MFLVDSHRPRPRLRLPGRRAPLRERKRAHWLAPLAAACTIGMGLVNVDSALTPGLQPRMRLLLELVPGEVPVAAHALALSAGVALVILGVYLMRRRRRAWALAVGVLIVAGALNLLKGLDVEEAFACWALAGVLIAGRGAFTVVHEDSGWRVPLLRSAAVLGGVFAASIVTLLAVSHWGTPGLNPARTLAELTAALTLSPGPVDYRDHFEWVPGALVVLWTGGLLTVAWQLFRPLAGPRGLPPGELRPLAHELVASHGTDTLSFFKLRTDKHHFFDRSRRAFVGYRIEAGVLLVSGDPVGPAEVFPGLLRDLCGFAEARGLAIGVVGASEEFAELATGAGLASFYIGDAGARHEVAPMVADMPAPDAVGVRFVHGGTDFTAPVVVDARVTERLEALADLAPLHQPASLHALAEITGALPGVPAVACFDTAFHATLPDAAATYALPAEWRERYGLRRYGFHGLSYSYAVRRTREMLGELPSRTVVCHLGSGASLAAVADGRSVDTTMGFTPLEGLVMASRAGSVDPGIPLWLIKHGIEASEVNEALEHRSGLRGLAGTGDMREIRERAEARDAVALAALDVYHHRLRACAAAMAATLGGLDALVFTGGVGEHDPFVRHRLAEDLAFLGVSVDPARNEDARDDADVTAGGSAVRVLVVTAREDLEIAAGVRGCLEEGRPGHGRASGRQ